MGDMVVPTEGMVADMVVMAAVMAVLTAAVMAAVMAADMAVVMEDMATVTEIPNKWDHLALFKPCSMEDIVK